MTKALEVETHSFQEQLLIEVIDQDLSDVRYVTVIEGWKVRDMLLDLRTLVQALS